MSFLNSLIPSALTRSAIRKRLSIRLKTERRGSLEERDRRFAEFLEDLGDGPIAGDDEDALYQLPTEFHAQILGPRMLHGAGLWSAPRTTLAESEEAMLRLVGERAELGDGQKILELGCGWGALTFWLAERFPNASITAVSDSYVQRLHMEEEARRREFYNVRILPAGYGSFSAPEPGSYDRVVSLDLLPRLKNYRLLFNRVSTWLKPGGKFFLQTTAHREHAYRFGGKNAPDWLARQFPSGGTMPSPTLLLHFQEDLSIERQWRLEGLHAARTAESWLNRLDGNRKAARLVLERIHGRPEARRHLARWRVFLMACAELSSWRNREEWLVSQSLFQKQVSKE